MFSTKWYRPKETDKNLLLEEIKSLSVENNALSLARDINNHTGQELVELCAAIPAHITMVDLSDTVTRKFKQSPFFDNTIITVAEFISALKALHPGVKTLSLANNNFGHDNLSANDLKNVLLAIPPSVTELNLSGNFLDKHMAALASAFTQLRVTVLDLSSNCFCNNPDGLVTALRAIPADTVKTLNVSDNGLGDIEDDSKGEKLTAVFAAMPSSVITLNVSRNSLGKPTNEVLSKAFTAIRASLESLDLTNNSLGSKFNALRVALSSVKYLNLKGNFSYKCDAGAFSAISSCSSLISLDLSDNHFSLDLGLIDNKLVVTGNSTLRSIFPLIPASVTTLNISCNRFVDSFLVEMPKFAEMLAGAFTAIPVSVCNLNLNDNNFGFCSDEQLGRIFSTISAGVTHLGLAHTEIRHPHTGIPTNKPLSLSAVAKIAKLLAESHPKGISLDLTGNWLNKQVVDALPAEISHVIYGAKCEFVESFNTKQKERKAAYEMFGIVTNRDSTPLQPELTAIVMDYVFYDETHVSFWRKPRQAKNKASNSGHLDAETGVAATTAATTALTASDDSADKKTPASKRKSPS